MKIRVKQIASVIGFCILLGAVLWKVAGILERKDSVIKYGDFAAEEEDFDVLFLGSSHIINAVFPMELWNDYGIVSYNLGVHGSKIPTAYEMLQNALEETTPQLVVIDVYDVESQNKRTKGEKGIGFLHDGLDWKPWSVSKYNSIQYLLDETDRKMEFFFPISLYHDRWNELSESDFKIPYSVEKGADSRIGVRDPQEFSLVPREEVKEVSSLGKEYLGKIIKECREKNIEVLLVNIPYPASARRQRISNGIDKFAAEQGVNYVNFFYEDTGVDFQIDCYDPDSHLNPSGARKVTDYLGSYLKQHYQLPDRRADAAYQSWNQDYQDYEKFKITNIQECNELYDYLMLLRDKSLNYRVQINEGSQLWKSEKLERLMDNLGDLQKFAEAKENQTGYLLQMTENRVIADEQVGEQNLNYDVTIQVYADDGTILDEAEFQLQERTEVTRYEETESGSESE